MRIMPSDDPSGLLMWWSAAMFFCSYMSGSAFIILAAVITFILMGTESVAHRDYADSAEQANVPVVAHRRIGNQLVHVEPYTPQWRADEYPLTGN